MSAFFAPLIASRSEHSLHTESQTVCLSQTSSGDSSKQVSLSTHGSLIQKPGSGKHPGNKTAAQQDLANRILNRLKKLPDISEGPSGGEHPETTTTTSAVNYIIAPLNQYPSQDSGDHKTVTPGQLAAYFQSGGSPEERPSDAQVKERIPHRQHPCLQPPKCVSNLAVYTNINASGLPMCSGTEDGSNVVSAGAGRTLFGDSGCNSAGYSMHIEEGDEEAYPQFSLHAKPSTAVSPGRPVIPRLKLPVNYSAGVSYTVTVIPAPQPTLMSMFLGGASRVAVAPA